MKKENRMATISSLALAAFLAMGTSVVYADEEGPVPAPVQLEETTTTDEVVVEETTATEEVANETTEETTEEVSTESETPQVEVTPEEPVLVVGPDTEVLIGYAEEIIAAIEDKLEWSDVPVVMEMSAKMLGHLSNLSVEQKRVSLIEVLNYVIDHTDTPWLPDRWTDPFFKAMVPPFAHIFITDDFLKELDFSVPEELVANQDFVGVADLIREKFSDGFNWSDLTFTVGAAFTFGAQLDDLSWEERGQVMSDLVDYVVDNTDTPWLPDHFSDPVFKAFAHSTINVLVMSKKNEEAGAADEAASIETLTVEE